MLPSESLRLPRFSECVDTIIVFKAVSISFLHSSSRHDLLSLCFVLFLFLSTSVSLPLCRHFSACFNLLQHPPLLLTSILDHESPSLSLTSDHVPLRPLLLRLLLAHISILPYQPSPPDHLVLPYVQPYFLNLIYYQPWDLMLFYFASLSQ